VLTSITPFGQTGPYSRFKASDIEIMALSGCMSLTGDPDRPPLRVTFPQSYGWTGSYAAMGALIAHHYREQTGEGQQVDVSAQACLLWAFSHAHTFWDLNRHVEKRAGSFMTGRSNRCADEVFWRKTATSTSSSTAARRQATNQALVVDGQQRHGLDFLKQKD
jgi:crotonobetainyl-CoA:carnitine CoA-transferase CaiB-like acyl-CoA transferase